MSAARVYLALTPRLLRRCHDAGEVPASTDRVVATGDAEDEEYAALQDAADLAAGLLGGRPGRRVVLVAEVGDPRAAVPMRRVVAVHADDADVDPADDDPPELGWWATQEIPDLLALLDA
ncbi:hypothetical protein SAMN04488570_1497 [Nocardioides scoriae]|uniref:Uncharacterized protein n=1 Tax=Nocardioides scoriae TaxID=642780 RepID=A0A1H1QT92_9ACTN|nr:hypothetical protein [Nocardioides scoriae]SDS26625.1 hypothetical protein SAMN04488570_1497 [Nocardioides scoriae]